jgi:hypothetical protein
VTDELFRTARDYHGALAAYRHAMRASRLARGADQPAAPEDAALVPAFRFVALQRRKAS